MLGWCLTCLAIVGAADVHAQTPLDRMQDLIGPGESSSASGAAPSGESESATTQPSDDDAPEDTKKAIDWSNPREVARYIWDFPVLPSGDS